MTKGLLPQFLDVLRRHNAIYLGDSGLREAYEAFLTKHKIARKSPTKEQLDYQKTLNSMFPVVKKVD